MIGRPNEGALIVTTVASLIYTDVFEKTHRLDFGFAGMLLNSGFNTLSPMGEEFLGPEWISKNSLKMKVSGTA